MLRYHDDAAPCWYGRGERTLTTATPVRVHALTDVGLVHPVNEDSHSITSLDEGGLLLVVCDGMGGMGHGDLASRLAVDSIVDSVKNGVGFPSERLSQALRTADNAVRQELCDGSRGFPGSTAVVVYLVDGLAHVCWAGDSRAYLVRSGAVIERTRDHKLVEDLVRAGQLSREEAAESPVGHIVTRALGGRSRTEKALRPESVGQPWKLHRGDTIVLCSDGLCDLVSDEELPGVIADKPPDTAAKALVELALERGGHDNITVIHAQWDGEDYVEDDHATPAFQSREVWPEHTVLDPDGADSMPRPETEELDPSWRPGLDVDEDGEDIEDAHTLPTMSTPVVAVLPKVAVTSDVPDEPAAPADAPGGVSDRSVDSSNGTVWPLGALGMILVVLMALAWWATA